MTSPQGVSRLAPRPARDTAFSQVLLVCRLDDRAHALPAEHVVEVVRMVAATPLPEAPPWIRGLVNFRGQVIPLIDVRSRLGLAGREPGLSTPIVVVAAGQSLAGLLVDEVEEVVALDPEALEDPAPGIPAVSAVARRGEQLILVLDHEHICADSSDWASATERQDFDGSAR